MKKYKEYFLICIYLNVIILSGCSVRHLDINSEMLKDTKQIFEITDDIILEKRTPTQQEKDRIVNFSNKYSEKKNIKTLTENEKKALEYVNLAGQSAFMFAVAIEQNDLNSQSKILENYIIIRKEIDKMF